MTDVTVRNKAKELALDIFLSTPNDGEMTMDDIIDGAMDVFFLNTKDAVTTQKCLVSEGEFVSKRRRDDFTFEIDDKMITPAGVVFFGTDRESAIQNEIDFLSANYDDFGFVIVSLQYLVGYFASLSLLAEDGSIELLMSRRDIDRMIANTIVFIRRLSSEA